MNLKNVEDYFCKTIKVTYDEFSGTDKYDVIGFDDDKEVIIRKLTGPKFTVSSTWFTAQDSGRHIKIIN